MIINLDPNFNPYPKEEVIKYEAFQFKGGEPHIKIASELSNVKEVTLTHRIQSFNDVGLLLVTVDALRRMGIKSIHAVIPYFPGARQDRVMVQGEPLTVKVCASLLNSLALSSITVYDPHSEVTPANG